MKQESSISIPGMDYISVDKRMWNSIKNRLKIVERFFDGGDFLKLYVGGVVGGWISYFGVDKSVQPGYFNWLIGLSILGIIAIVFSSVITKTKQDFKNTILYDMDSIEKDC